MTHTTYVDPRHAVERGRVTRSYFAACTCGWDELVAHRHPERALVACVRHQSANDETPDSRGNGVRGS